jgi:bifunctional DNase/RNase
MDAGSLVEMSVVKVSPYLRAERPLLWLCEKDAGRPRLLPIAIGQFEAAAIQMRLDQETPLRPISYDLIASILQHLEVPVRYVLIHSVRKQIYYARVAVEHQRQVKELDSRPSDAVALALRTSAPVYVSQALLSEAGLGPLDSDADIEQAIFRFYEPEQQVVEELVPEDLAAEPELPGTAPQAEAPGSEPVLSSRQDRLSQLQHQLEQAVICEEFEEAARLRDQIETLSNQATEEG